MGPWKRDIKVNCKDLATTGGQVWEAAYVLAEYLEKIQNEIGLNRPCRILELGAGTGWLGLVLAKNLPNAQVTLTDRDECGQLDWLRHNASLNDLDNVTVAELEWTEMGDFPREWDFVVGSDLVYNETVARLLPPVLAELKSSQIWIAFTSWDLEATGIFKMGLEKTGLRGDEKSRKQMEWEDNPMLEICPDALSIDVFHVTDVESASTTATNEAEEEKVHIIELKTGHSLEIVAPFSFGLGDHPTTRLMIDWMESPEGRQWLPGKKVLDYGCGTGILGLVAQRLGAFVTTMVDIEPPSLAAARKNFEANGMEGEFYLPPADMLEGCPDFSARYGDWRTVDWKPFVVEPKYDVVLCNIVAGVLYRIAPTLFGCMKEEGMLALAGLKTFQLQRIMETYDGYFDLEKTADIDDWVLVTGSRAAASSL